jgi:hypothetical protein
MMMLRYQTSSRRRHRAIRVSREELAMTEPSSDAPSASQPQAWQASACLDILNDIQEQIRFADSKAGFIAAFNVLLFGFVATHMDKLRTLCGTEKLSACCITAALVLVGIYVTLTVITFGLVVSCVVSRFGGRVRQSRVFFAHIADQYGKNHKRYSQDISRMTNAEWLDEIGGQVVEVSRLAMLKHRRVRWAAYCTLLSVLLWVGSLVTMVSIFWTHAS